MLPEGPIWDVRSSRHAQTTRPPALYDHSLGVGVFSYSPFLYNYSHWFGMFIVHVPR